MGGMGAKKGSAIIRAHAPLTRRDQQLVSEALRRGEETRNTVEHALVEYGRWLLIHVFADDARAALERRRDNAIWRELLARAGGPTLRLSPRFMHVAITIAAHDKRITDDSWRLLEPARKQLLLPLGDEAAMREAAQHVVKMKLSHRATSVFVRGLREASKPRALTKKQIGARIRAFRGVITDAASRRAIEHTLANADAAEQKRLRSELSSLRAWTTSILQRLPRPRR